ALLEAGGHFAICLAAASGNRAADAQPGGGGVRQLLPHCEAEATANPSDSRTSACQNGQARVALPDGSIEKLPGKTRDGGRSAGCWRYWALWGNADDRERQGSSRR